MKEMETRQYQEDLIREVCSSKDNVLVVAPTGSGKTYIARRIAEGTNNRVLFVTPRIDLVTQTLQAFDNKADVIWRGAKDTGQHVVIASRQTLLLKPERFLNWNLNEFTFILDEVHIGLDRSKFLVDYFKPRRVLGLTATPERTDGLSFIKGSEVAAPDWAVNKDSRFKYGLFDRYLEPVSIQDLQEAGYLSKLKYTPNTDIKLTKVKTNFDELRYEQFKEFVEDPKQVAKLATFLKQNETRKPYLVFTPSVAAAEHWNKQLNDLGYNMRVVSGSTPKQERDLLYKQAELGEIDGLVNCALLTYGFDLPAAKTIVLIRNIKSRPLYIQTVGRVLRPYMNKEAVFFDYAGTGNNFITKETPNPNLFADRINYRITGEWKRKGHSVTDTDTSVTDTIGEENLAEYMENPLQCLLRLLAEKDDSLLEEAYKSVQFVIQQNQQLAVQNQQLQVQTSNLEQLRTWFKKDSFNWSKHDFVRILRHYNYDCRLPKNREQIGQIYKACCKSIPVQPTKENEQYFQKQLANVCHYWFEHFEPRT